MTELSSNSTRSWLAADWYPKGFAFYWPGQFLRHWTTWPPLQGINARRQPLETNPNNNGTVIKKFAAVFAIAESFISDRRFRFVKLLWSMGRAMVAIEGRRAGRDRSHEQEQERTHGRIVE